MTTETSDPDKGHVFRKPEITTYGEKPPWLAARNDPITGWFGASDVPGMIGADVLRCNTFSSRIEVWGDKTKLIPPRERTAAELKRMNTGLRMERTIGEIYAEETGEDVRFPAPYTVWRPHGLPLGATLDATISPTVGRHERVLQIKNVSQFMAKDWEDGPPTPYRCQVLAEMLCSGMTEEPGVLCAFVGGHDLVCFDIPFHEVFAQKLEKMALDLWKLVETKTMPEADGSDSCRRALQRLHPDDDGSEVPLGLEYMEDAAIITTAKATIKAADETKKLAENRIRAAIKGATFGVLPDGRRISYKTQTRPEHRVKESTFRVLRIPKLEV